MKKIISVVTIISALLSALFLFAKIAPGPKLVDFTNTGDGTVYDRKTKLTWAKCSLGQRGETCTGEAKKYTYGEAVTACSDLDLGGKTGWRIPTGFELSYIVDCNGVPYAPMPDGISCFDSPGKKYPLVDTNFFPAVRKYYYWAKKDDDCDFPPDKCAAAIDFGDADNGKLSSGVDADKKYYIRCVHGDYYSIW